MTFRRCALVGLLVVAMTTNCGRSSHGGARGGGGTTGTGQCIVAAPTPFAALQDGTGEALARAVREHEPTADEMRRAAAFWAFMIVMRETGQLDPAFFMLDLQNALPNAAELYPSFFNAACMSTASSSITAHTRWLQTGGPSPTFSCNESCTQSYPERAAFFQEIGEQMAGFAIDAAATFKAAQIVKDVTDALVARPTSIATVLQDSVSEISARDMLQITGEWICGVGAAASAAVALGATAPALPIIAATGAVVGLGMTVIQFNSRFISLAEHYGACAGWKLANCEAYTEGRDPCLAAFNCSTGPCIPSGSACSGADDCVDGSDEAIELCSPPARCCAATRGCNDCCCPGGNCCDEGFAGAGGSDGMGGAANGGAPNGGAGGEDTGGAAGSGGDIGDPGGGAGGNGGSGPIEDPPDAAVDNPCCACNFDVYCTEFGQGGCWYCSEYQYLPDGATCPAPQGWLVSPGACMCDPELFQVCQ